MTTFLYRSHNVRSVLGLRILARRAFYQLIEKPFRRIVLSRNVTHISGFRELSYKEDEVIVVCVVRDGELYLKSFIDHYRTLGVKHIVFLDNNSTDNTVEVAGSYENVTVLQTKLPFKKYEPVMRSYLINRFAKGRWCLCADIDELFSYPHSDKLNLKSLLLYLNYNRFTAVVAQMLDLFEQGTILTRVNNPEDSLKEIYRYYDISKIRKEDYFAFNFGDTNELSNPDIKLFLGGIRQQIFGLDGIYLTKHPLIFKDNKIQPMRTEHTLRHSYVADFTGVLLHYRFLGNLYEYAEREYSEGNFFDNSVEWKKSYAVLRDQPNITIAKDTSKELSNVNDLLDNNFLKCK